MSDFGAVYEYALQLEASIPAGMTAEMEAIRPAVMGMTQRQREEAEKLVAMEPEARVKAEAEIAAKREEARAKAEEAMRKRTAEVAAKLASQQPRAQATPAPAPAPQASVAPPAHDDARRQK